MSHRIVLLIAGACFLPGVAEATANDVPVSPDPGNGNRKSFLGVTTESTPFGERITGVVPESPAAKAGLEAGDVILEVDGYRVGIINGQVFSLASEIRRSVGTIKLSVRDRRTGRVVALEATVSDTGTPPGGGSESGSLPPDESGHFGGGPSVSPTTKPVRIPPREPVPVDPSESLPKRIPPKHG